MAWTLRSRVNRLLLLLVTALAAAPGRRPGDAVDRHLRLPDHAGGARLCGLVLRVQDGEVVRAIRTWTGVGGHRVDDTAPGKFEIYRKELPAAVQDLAPVRGVLEPRLGAARRR